MQTQSFFLSSIHILSLKNIFKNYPIPLLIIIFCLTELIINPIGNFPLNDDWWYAHIFKKLFIDHSKDRVAWGSTSLYGQLLLTKIFTFIFGYSYTGLRLFTLLLSISSIIFFFKICVDFLNIEQKIAFTLSLLILFNPLFLCLSNSYMTDVPFLFMLLGAVYFYLYFRKSQNTVYFYLSVSFFVLAILTRQIGLMFIFGLFSAEVYQTKKLKLKTILIVLIPLFSLFIFEYWLKHKTNNIIYTYVFFRNQSIQNKIPLLDSGLNFCKRWVHYVSISGFTLFPLLIPYVFYSLFKRNIKFSLPVFIISLALFIPVFISMQKFPIGNYINKFGVGPDTLFDTYMLNINHSNTNSFLIFDVIKLLGYLASFGFIFLGLNFASTFYSQIKIRSNYNFITLFLVLSLLLYYASLSFTSAIFDRYILVFTLFAILITHHEFLSSLAKNFLFPCLLVLLIVFSVFSTKDYLQSHRTKWVAVNFLKNVCHISDKQINAGYEHEGSSFPESTFWYSKWLNSPPNDYLITKGPVKDYSLFDYFTYQRFIPFKTDTIFILKLNKLTPK